MDFVRHIVVFLWSMSKSNNLASEYADIQEYFDEIEKSVPVSGNANGIYKHGTETSINKSKQDAISELKKCTYRTPPLQIEQLLLKLFIDYDSKPGHWLYIAQHYHPRAINWVINGMIKTYKYGWQTIKNPPAYFTHTLKKFYKPRKNQRIKQQEKSAIITGL